MNRPNYGGNNFTSINNNTNISHNNIGGNNNYFGGNNNFVGNVGGTGGWGGGWGAGTGGWGGGYGGGYRGWASPYYGNWYRGSVGGNGFWAGLGVGALATGIGSAVGSASYAYASPYYGYSAYSYFPTWSAANYDGWGLGSLTPSLLAANYSNPYYETAVATQPASTTAVYDYSQPINLAAVPPGAADAESTEQVFSAARDSFKAGDYPRAVNLADQVLKQTPNVPVVHEFRALALFAQKRYDEAASVDYAVLSAGPGWNWSTLINLYADVETYTNQLRALEAFAKDHPDSSSAHFLLAYHYMVQEHNDSAAREFETVTKIQPNETLSASFVKALRQNSETPATAAQPTPAESPTPPQVAANTAPTQPGTPSTEATSAEPTPPPPPPADMAGNWTAKPSTDVTIELNLQKDGAFSWSVEEKGRKQTIEGQAGFQDDTLALLQSEGPPLVGKVTRRGADKFLFAPPGTNDKSPGLAFSR